MRYWLAVIGWAVLTVAAIIVGIALGVWLVDTVVVQ